MLYYLTVLIHLVKSNQGGAVADPLKSEPFSYWWEIGCWVKKLNETFRGGSNLPYSQLLGVQYQSRQLFLGKLAVRSEESTLAEWVCSCLKCRHYFLSTYQPQESPDNANSATHSFPPTSHLPRSQAAYMSGGSNHGNIKLSQPYYINLIHSLPLQEV